LLKLLLWCLLFEFMVLLSLLTGGEWDELASVLPPNAVFFNASVLPPNAVFFYASILPPNAVF